MAKRPRGKQAGRLAKRAKELGNIDKQLGSNSWDSLSGNGESYDYENRPRSFKQLEEDNVERLPVKTQEGKIHRVITKSQKKKRPEEVVESEEDDSEDDDDAEEEEFEGFEDQEDESSDDETGGPGFDLHAATLHIKETIASAAESLNEDPEENITKLRELKDLLARTKHFKLKRIILLSMVTIFKSLIPGYRIRPLTEMEKKEKVTKEVKRLRNFEEMLVSNYSSYVSTLTELSKKGQKAEIGTVKYTLAATSVNCACELLLAVPYFNFRNDLITILVKKLSYKNADQTFSKCISTIETIFQNDFEGHVSFDVVRMITKMIKSRHYKVLPEVLNTLLHLRLLMELEGQADLEKVQLAHEDEAREEAHKLKKKDRVHLSKKERKKRKEQKEIEKEHQKAETAVSVEERERIQGETLKLVFILYFNILKERSKDLLGVTLEGLAKFSHLINADFFGDLLEVLRELIIERQQNVQADGSTTFKESSTREALLCTVTAFTLLQGQYKKRQMESMNLDLAFFVSHFFSSLFTVAMNPDIELNYKSLRIEDELLDEKQKKPKINVSTEMELVVRSLESIFFLQKTVNRHRVQAFAKRLAMMVPHLPEKSAIAALRILDRLNKRYTTQLSGLYSSDDRVANGVFQPLVDDPEQCNSEAATIWETILLEKHYSPVVAKASKVIPKTFKNSS